MDKTRYFYIVYNAVVNDRQNINGCSSVTTDGTYFNLWDFNNVMIKQLNARSIVVNNIIELSESDFNDLYKK